MEDLQRPSWVASSLVSVTVPWGLNKYVSKRGVLYTRPHHMNT